MIPRQTDWQFAKPLPEPEAPLQFTEQVRLDVDFVFTEAHVLTVSLVEGQDSISETDDVFTITFAPPGPHITRRLVYIRKAQLRAVQQTARVVQVPLKPHEPTL